MTAKLMLQIFLAVCTLICWVISKDIEAGLFAIALAIISIEVGGTDE